MGGFHMTSGAIASSVGHDNHNIIVMGTNFEDMSIAVNHLVEIGGGQCLVDGGEVGAFNFLVRLAFRPFVRGACGEEERVERGMR